MTPGLSDRDRERFAELRSKLEDVDQAEFDPDPLDGPPGPLDPMLASSFDGELGALEEDQWIAERKFDGTRLLLEKFDGEVRLFTRRHIERSETLPELTKAAAETIPDGCILDGEYTFLTPEGRSRFVPIHAAGDKIEAENLTERFYVFDIIAADGEWCTRGSLLERKDRLAETVPDADILTTVDFETARFETYYDDLVSQGEEGIIIKQRQSAYHLGTRSEHWQKVKAFTETDVIVVGYTEGKGTRADTFGALVMTDGDDYCGRVGSGFDDAELEELLDWMTPTDERPVSKKQVGMAYTPVEPFVVQVKYQEVTESGELRAPVYLRSRPEKPLEDVAPIET